MNYIKYLRQYVKNEPLIMVSSAAIIIKNGNILLQRRKDFNTWALHGGAMELGESLEQTLKREVKEEVNIDILDFHYYKVFSGEDFKITYPNKDQVYLVDHIFVVTNYIGEIKGQAEEVNELKWFKLDEIPWNNLLAHNKIILEDFIKNYK